MISTNRPMIDGKAAGVASNTVVYAIGDIHGRVDLLRELYRRIEQDAEKRDVEKRVIVHLGDYIDRGPNAKEVIGCFCTPPLNGFERHWLLGNHEYDMLQFLAGDPAANRWLLNGGRETLQSYGITFGTERCGDRELDRLRTALRENLPAEHQRFLNNLGLVYENGDFLFVHAGLRPGVAIEAQSTFDLLWIRGPFLNTTQEFGRIIVHGHSPFRTPQVRHNRIGIDTGAYHTGHLTALVLRGSELSFLQT